MLPAGCSSPSRTMCCCLYTHLCVGCEVLEQKEQTQTYFLCNFMLFHYEQSSPELPSSLHGRSTPVYLKKACINIEKYIKIWMAKRECVVQKELFCPVIIE